MPVVRAIGARHCILGLAAVACRSNADGLAVLVVAAGPVHGHEVLGRNELAVGAVEHEEETVLGRMQYDLARLAGDLDVGQDHGLGGGVVPVVARRFLVVPLVFAGVGIQSHDGSQIQVVAALGAAHLVRPGRAVARAHVHGVELGIEGHAVPHGAAAAGLPPLAAGIPGLGGALHGFVLEGFGRIAGHAEPAPFLLAGLGVIGRDVAAHAIFGAAVADDDLALEHARSARDGERALLPLEGILVPDLLAGGGIQRDQAAIPCTHIDLALPQCHAAVDDVAAPLEAGAAVDLRVIGPDPVAGTGVDGVHNAPRGTDVHDAVHDHRRGLHAARGFEVVRPGQAQVLDVGGIDLIEAAVAGLGIVHAGGGPVGRLGGIGADESAIDSLHGGRGLRRRVGLREGRCAAQAGGQHPGHAAGPSMRVVDQPFHRGLLL